MAGGLGPGGGVGLEATWFGATLTQFYTLFDFLLEASAGFSKTLRLSRDRGIFSQQFLSGGKPFWFPF